MINQLIKMYRKSQMELVEKIANEDNFFLHEVSFFDDGRCSTIVKELQVLYKEIIEELNYAKEYRQDDQDKIIYLKERKFSILRSMAVLGSQNIKNLEQCIALYGPIRDSFYPCMMALKAYKDGNTEECFNLLSENMKSDKDFSQHYLLNKIYGELLFEKKIYDKAFVYLYNTAQICPNDIDVHRKLQKIYQMNNNSFGEKVEKDIIEILEDEG